MSALKYLKFPKRKKIVVVFFLLLLPLLYNFPFLLYPIGNPPVPINNQVPISLAGNALFISDVHFLGEPMDLGTYLEAEEINNLIIIGDLFLVANIFDEFGITATLQLLNLDTYVGQIYFIWGNHDPHVNITAPNFQTLGHFGFFTIQHHTILAHHGTYQSRFGEIAFVVNYIISYPILEQLWRIRVGIPEEIWVFTGHNHIAKLYPELKIGTCGTFIGSTIFDLPLGEGIQVDEHIRLVTIPF